ncbi:MAG: HRDC domain-containing protein [Saprospirales bacterium]|nr:HRDC domain-containing protein [Saprospirales bacterium]
MKEWRKQMSADVGLPVYMVATNAQFVSIIQQKCVTLESLKLVKGFGKAKIEKYGKALTDIVRQFYHGEVSA